jgi:hypothetical protein
MVIVKDYRKLVIDYILLAAPGKRRLTLTKARKTPEGEEGREIPGESILLVPIPNQCS